MHADDLVRAACEQAGFDDFGAPTFRDGLDRYVESLARDAGLTELGELALEAQITKNLVNRLRVTEWLVNHPEALETPIDRPLVVLGLPRTGTTLLAELLHCDPENRSLMRWEAQSAVPPPEATSSERDPRIEETAADGALLDTLNPGFKAIHHERADGPTECVAILSQDFKSLLWEVLAFVPSYGTWLRDCDQGSAYAYHHRELALLQARAPGRWALKTPHHALAIDALVAEYPDAQLVMTHRDPITVVASLCSLVHSMTSTFSDVDHGSAINEHWISHAETIVSRVATWRDAHGDDRLVDVAYDELVAEPVTTVRRIYEHFGRDLSTTAERAMTRYVTEHPQGEHGRHAYDLDALGLDRRELESRFEAYRARFDIPRDQR